MRNHFGNGSMNAANHLQNRMSTKTVDTTSCENWHRRKSCLNYITIRFWRVLMIVYNTQNYWVFYFLIYCMMDKVQKHYYYIQKHTNSDYITMFGSIAYFWSPRNKSKDWIKLHWRESCWIRRRIRNTLTS
jgi:hypothetical protein